jgi:hypothetical protein
MDISDAWPFRVRGALRGDAIGAAIRDTDTKVFVVLARENAEDGVRKMEDTIRISDPRGSVCRTGSVRERM